MATTWSTTDKNNCTLSGGDLVATFGANGGVRSTDRVYSGKYYWEQTFTTTTNASVGVQLGGVPFTVVVGAVNSMAAAVTNGGNVFILNASLGSIGGTFTAGWVACIALDVTNQRIWFRNGAAGNWNNNVANNPATGVGGYTIATFGGPGYGIYALANGGGGGGVITANFGATAFVGAVPSGFTSGFPDSTTLITSEVATQLAAEQWLSTDPRAQLTQISVEQWASVQSTTGQVVVSQMLIEQWASVDLPVSAQAVRVMVLA